MAGQLSPLPRPDRAHAGGEVTYDEFLKSKRITHQNVGLHLNGDRLHPMLFPFQTALTKWALQKGRCAIFADTGLGKTLMQLEWAKMISQRANGKVLIVAPLSVTRQTVREGEKLGLRVDPGTETGPHSIEVTNYERLDNFDPTGDKGIVLDESSILKY